MQILSGTAGDLPRQVMAGIACYRHKVFIDMLGWSLPVRNGMELDQFDRAVTNQRAQRVYERAGWQRNDEFHTYELSLTDKKA